MKYFTYVIHHPWGNTAKYADDPRPWTWFVEHLEDKSFQGAVSAAEKLEPGQSMRFIGDEYHWAVTVTCVEDTESPEALDLPPTQAASLTKKQISKYIKDLDDPNAYVREVATEQLGRGGVYDAISRMLDDPDEDVRWEAQKYLRGKTRQPAVQMELGARAAVDKEASALSALTLLVRGTRTSVSEGNWHYYRDDDHRIHVIYHETEVVTADDSPDGEERVTQVTTGGWNTVSTKQGIRRVLYALDRLGFWVPEIGPSYEYNSDRRVTLDDSTEPLDLPPTQASLVKKSQSEEEIIAKLKQLVMSCGEYYSWSISGEDYSLYDTLTYREIGAFLDDYAVRLTDRELFEEWEEKITGSATSWDDSDFDDYGRYTDSLHVYDNYMFETYDGGEISWDFSFYGGEYSELSGPVILTETSQAAAVVELLEKWPSDVDTLLNSLGGGRVAKDRPAVVMEARPLELPPTQASLSRTASTYYAFRGIERTSQFPEWMDLLFALASYSIREVTYNDTTDAHKLLKDEEDNYIHVSLHDGRVIGAQRYGSNQGHFILHAIEALTGLTFISDEEDEFGEAYSNLEFDDDQGLELPPTQAGVDLRIAKRAQDVSMLETVVNAFNHYGQDGGWVRIPNGGMSRVSAILLAGSIWDALHALRLEVDSWDTSIYREPAIGGDHPEGGVHWVNVRLDHAALKTLRAEISSPKDLPPTQAHVLSELQIGDMVMYDSVCPARVMAFNERSGCVAIEFDEPCVNARCPGRLWDCGGVVPSGRGWWTLPDNLTLVDAAPPADLPPTQASIDLGLSKSAQTTWRDIQNITEMQTPQRSNRGRGQSSSESYLRRKRLEMLRRISLQDPAEIWSTRVVRQAVEWLIDHGYDEDVINLIRSRNMQVISVVVFYRHRIKELNKWGVFKDIMASVALDPTFHPRIRHYAIHYFHDMPYSDIRVLEPLIGEDVDHEVVRALVNVFVHAGRYDKIIHYLESPDPQVRDIMLSSLPRTDEYAPIIASFLADPDEGVRVDAMRFLGLIPHSEWGQWGRELSNQREDRLNAPESASAHWRRWLRQQRDRGAQEEGGSDEAEEETEELPPTQASVLDDKDRGVVERLMRGVSPDAIAEEDGIPVEDLRRSLRERIIPAVRKGLPAKASIQVIRVDEDGSRTRLTKRAMRRDEVKARAEAVLKVNDDPLVRRMMSNILASAS